VSRAVKIAARRSGPQLDDPAYATPTKPRPRRAFADFARPGSAWTVRSLSRSGRSPNVFPTDHLGWLRLILQAPPPANPDRDQHGPVDHPLCRGSSGARGRASPKCFRPTPSLSERRRGHAISARGALAKSSSEKPATTRICERCRPEHQQRGAGPPPPRPTVSWVRSDEIHWPLTLPGAPPLSHLPSSVSEEAREPRHRPFVSSLEGRFNRAVLPSAHNGEPASVAPHRGSPSNPVPLARLPLRGHFGLLATIPPTADGPPLGAFRTTRDRGPPPDPQPRLLAYALLAEERCRSRLHARRSPGYSRCLACGGFWTWERPVPEAPARSAAPLRPCNPGPGLRAPSGAGHAPAPHRAPPALVEEIRERSKCVGTVSEPRGSARCRGP